ncbi:hypothetical protein B0H19DRAFT_865314, partial [Mycena capillaripes]
VGLYIYRQYCNTDLQDSVLPGRGWLAELLNSHQKHIYIALGMRQHVFLALVLQLYLMGHMESQNSRVSLNESVVIFLY